MPVPGQNRYTEDLNPVNVVLYSGRRGDWTWGRSSAAQCGDASMVFKSRGANGLSKRPNLCDIQPSTTYAALLIFDDSQRLDRSAAHEHV